MTALRGRSAAPVIGPLLFAVSVAAGCGDGPMLVDVTGTVTIDGTPLDNATVVFRPKQGRPSYGVTDAQGRYALRYTTEKLGALPGEHAVMITTAGGGNEDSPATKKETIPARYNRNTTLTATVDPSHRTHDFALESKK